MLGQSRNFPVVSGVGQKKSVFRTTGAMAWTAWEGASRGGLAGEAGGALTAPLAGVGECVSNVLTA